MHAYFNCRINGLLHVGVVSTPPPPHLCSTPSISIAVPHEEQLQTDLHSLCMLLARYRSRSY
jgi:hypothetical protein